MRQARIFFESSTHDELFCIMCACCVRSSCFCVSVMQNHTSYLYFGSRVAAVYSVVDTVGVEDFYSNARILD